MHVSDTLLPVQNVCTPKNLIDKRPHIQRASGECMLYATRQITTRTLLSNQKKHTTCKLTVGHFFMTGDKALQLS